jgi:hypothetical protein
MQDNDSQYMLTRAHAQAEVLTKTLSNVLLQKDVVLSEVLTKVNTHIEELKNILSFTQTKKKTTLGVLEVLNKSGKRLSVIRMGKGVNEDEDEQYDRYFCLGSLFEKVNRPQIAFANIRNELLYIVSPSKIQNNTLSDQKDIHVYTYMNQKERQELNNILKLLRKQAQFGDILAQETRTDPTIRKGYDIDLTDPIIKQIIHFGYRIEEDLADLFSEKMKIYDVRVTPYKINIYEKGDFFNEHFDTPEKNLIGTIIIHVDGDYNCMTIENVLWDSMTLNDVLWEQNLGNVLMFYTDVLHKVNPVPSYRQTITFKVWSKCVSNNKEFIDQIQNNNEITPLYKEIIDEMSHRINLNENFSVLLQNGYMFDNVITVNNNYDSDSESDLENVQNIAKRPTESKNNNDAKDSMQEFTQDFMENGITYNYLPNNLKGNDLLFYNIVRILGYKIRFVPVVLEQEHDINRDDYDYPAPSKCWIDDEKRGLTKTRLQKPKNIGCSGTSDEISASLSIYSAGEDMLATLYEIEKRKAMRLHSQLYDSLVGTNIYYLGLGKKIGYHHCRNLYTGNQYTGAAKYNIYLNILMVCYK